MGLKGLVIIAGLAGVALGLLNNPTFASQSICEEEFYTWVNEDEAYIKLLCIPMITIDEQGALLTCDQEPMQVECL